MNSKKQIPQFRDTNLTPFKEEGTALNVVDGKEVLSPIAPNAKERFLKKKRSKPNADSLVEKILQGDRVSLGIAITLIESTKSSDRDIASKIIDKTINSSGNSIRLGITGVPGVGKSTFIEAFGMKLIEMGKKVAVLSVDPSSGITGGSILGDKTRMEKLSGSEKAFIRPSPTSGSLGGVNKKTRETIYLCEAAGYDVIIVETVGVGQSETLVHSMTDFFLLLELAGAGDELQGIKKGIMEMADAIAITKADGDNIGKARMAKSEKEIALHLSRNITNYWKIPVMLTSAVTGEGVVDVYNKIEDYISIIKANGVFEEKRKRQLLNWFDSLLVERLEYSFNMDSRVRERRLEIESAILENKISPVDANDELIKIFRGENE
ncbi:MAG: methylmalonyl Co-A mutase-associated GTPase MeaB [Candidatus Cloacimonadota bacterium]|nr:MAG: methylmalonyl Co-A mutase-associated GTPase MeaB [Candidatus Cloacimonadota bacterium]PIE78480.1 MAG: methylmalonyl Co-A mutase-associated GTPase MeaB [Candidatus Delongbacteria bacterium]